MSVGGSLPGALLVAMNRGGPSPRPRVSGAGAARMSVRGSLPGALLVAMNRGGGHLHGLGYQAPVQPV